MAVVRDESVDDVVRLELRVDDLEDDGGGLPGDPPEQPRTPLLFVHKAPGAETALSKYDTFI